ncbi:hypothetical protein APY94_00145 [Thermococcus celericrescens]|uniref:Uncharacterized protein n=1 Tax=Thermococcus celericrescens TaxID=227598 RepID=A0A117IU83_9EURY|nr:hypothetical protein [Thermococcus celericrescens]KUH34821.1 hypothetical protein APY94_00145 [Thermococcus celericrescens]
MQMGTHTNIGSVTMNKTWMKIIIGIGGILSGPLFIWGAGGSGTSPALALGVSAISAVMMSFLLEYLDLKPTLKVQVARIFSLLFAGLWIWEWISLVRDPSEHLPAGWTTQDALWIFVLPIFIIGIYLRYKVYPEGAKTSSILRWVWGRYQNAIRMAKSATEGWIATPAFHILIRIAAVIMWIISVFLIWTIIEPIAWLIWTATYRKTTS